MQKLKDLQHSHTFHHVHNVAGCVYYGMAFFECANLTQVVIVAVLLCASLIITLTPEN